ncbi:MAG TPA: flagellar protein FlgN [Dissulfurispiraceae bacterium]|nr:flagellar protein FlgN [Dissulfurispiraceae bacterium]
MTPLYDELLAILDKEFDLCTRLVDLLQREKDVIVGLDPAALETLLQEKEGIVAGIRLCDESRDRLLTALGFENKTISDVAAAAEHPYRERLASLASKFKSIISSISELNRLNSILIEKSLHYVKTSFTFLDSFGIKPKQQVSLEA